MIKKYHIITVFFVIAIMSPGLSVAADTDWDAFVKLKEQYYYLDRQPLKEITCRIDVPLISDLVERIKQQLAPLQDKIEIRENLSPFALTYTPSDGLRFTDPEFEVIVKNSSDVADPEKLKNGIATMQSGFNQQIEGVKEILRGIFDDYASPTQKRYQNLSLARTEEGVVISYEFKGYQVTETYRDHTIRTLQTGPNAKITATQTYGDTSGGKLLVQQGSATIEQPMGTVQTDFTIDYQTVNQVMFPKTITNHTEFTVNGVLQKGTVDIFLKDCQAQ